LKTAIARALRVLVVLLVVAALIAGARHLIQRKRKELAAAPRYGMAPVPVEVAVARKGVLARTRDYLAVVGPVRRAAVSARLTATVEKVVHDEGDAVKAGEPLVFLDDREIRDDLAALAAQIEQAGAELSASQATAASLARSAAYWKREAERDRTLAKKGDIPAAQAEATADKANAFQGRLDSTRAKSRAIGHQIEALKKKSAQLATRLTYCVLRSPYHGVVARRLVDPGDLASPGKGLMVVEDRSQRKLSFDAPQRDLPEVREGLAVTFRVGGAERRAVLTHLYPSLDVARMLRAEVVLDGKAADGLDIGAYEPLSVVLEERSGVTLVPASAVIECPKHNHHVFVLRKDRLEHHQVKILGASGDDTAVEGIAPGEKVVTNTFLGWAKLAGGMKVEPVQ